MMTIGFGITTSCNMPCQRFDLHSLPVQMHATACGHMITKYCAGIVCMCMDLSAWLYCLHVHALNCMQPHDHDVMVMNEPMKPIRLNSSPFCIKDFESFTWTLNQINWWSGTSVGTTSASESIVCMYMPCMQLHGVTWSQTLINDGIVCMYMYATSAECQITNSGLIVLFACTCMQLHTAT